jgi:hypothetical protein
MIDEPKSKNMDNDNPFIPSSDLSDHGWNKYKCFLYYNVILI